MTIKTLLAPNKKSFWLAFFWTILILFLCLKNPSSEPKFYFPNADKIVHFGFYFGFVLLWFRFLVYKAKYSNMTLLILIFVSILFGISIEIAQKLLTTSRQADWMDIVANTFGSLSGYFVSKFVIHPKISK